MEYDFCLVYRMQHHDKNSLSPSPEEDGESLLEFEFFRKYLQTTYDFYHHLVYPGWSVGDTCLVHYKLMGHFKLTQTT